MAASRCTKTAPWPGRRENVMFNKRRRSLFKKANELSVKTSTELYIVMYRGGRYFTYNSTDRKGWPPNETDVVRPHYERTCSISLLNIAFQEMNYPLTDRQDPSDFHASSKRNARQQPRTQKPYHYVLDQDGNPERHQGSIGRAYVSPPSSPPIDGCSSPDLETTALLRAVNSGDIGIQGGEYFDGGTGVTNELEQSGKSAGVETSFRLFEQQDTNINVGQEHLCSITEAPKALPGMQDHTKDKQGKNCLGMSPALVSGRRKFVVPKLPDFSKLQEMLE